MKTVSRPNLERENPVICEKSGGDAVKLKTFFITASLWMGLLGLTACGGQTLRAADCCFLANVAQPLLRQSQKRRPVWRSAGFLI